MDGAQLAVLGPPERIKRMKWPIDYWTVEAIRVAQIITTICIHTVHFGIRKVDLGSNYVMLIQEVGKY